jgi:hypothetical protein
MFRSLLEGDALIRHRTETTSRIPLSTTYTVHVQRMAEALILVAQPESVVLFLGGFRFVGLNASSSLLGGAAPVDGRAWPTCRVVRGKGQ